MQRLSPFQLIPFLSILMVVCLPKSTTAQWFLEIGETIGIDQVVEDRAKLGGGAAFFDFDNDLDDDLYITGGLGRDQLYQNNGDGTFTDVSFFAGIGLTGQFFTTGIVTGDVDNDGFRDLYITTGSDFTGAWAPNLLLMNNGDGTFTERGQVSGTNGAARSFSATMFDYDLDADLDIYVVNYVEETRFLQDTLENGTIENIGYDHDCFDNFFYKNNGDGTFTEVNTELGLTDVGCGLAVTATDFDQDGDADLMIVNDFGEFVVPNALFENQYPQDTFINVSATRKADLQMYGMGVATGDYDLDGDFDYYFTNIGENYLLENQDGNFADVAEIAGVVNKWVIEPFTRTTSWGTVFADFNNDTYPDLFVANGQIEALSFTQTGRQDPNKLFINNGDKTFTDLSETAGIASDTRARGIAQSDYDQDGDLDMIVMVIDIPQQNNTNPKTLFYQNNAPIADNHWLQVGLEGVDCNPDAYGAIAKAYVGEKIMVQELVSGTSHLSQHSSILHFGLGDAMEVDSFEVKWPGGDSDWWYEVVADQRIYLRQAKTIVDSSNAVTVNFKVDMAQAEISQNGVYLAGDFVGENGTIILDELAEGIYETSLVLQPGTYEYRFVNGTPLFPTSFEALSEADSCTTVSNELVYRQLIVNEERTNYDLAAVCFNSCDTCKIVNGILDYTIEQPLFTLQPNLTRTNTQIHFVAEQYDEKWITVTNIHGQEVYRTLTTDISEELLVNNWNSGIYLVQVRFENGQLQTQKLVVH
ncbi:MAG: FG-GAP-like repeat-containing protein [Saprospiraceae bacterium]